MTDGQRNPACICWPQQASTPDPAVKPMSGCDTWVTFIIPARRPADRIPLVGYPPSPGILLSAITDYVQQLMRHSARGRRS